MPVTNQTLTCPQGDTFSFEIDMQPGDDNVAPDLTGASARWVLADSWAAGSTIYVTKTTSDDVTISNDAGVWKLTVVLEPADTADLSPGTLYHEARVALNDGRVSHVTTGTFNLVPSVSP